MTQDQLAGLLYDSLYEKIMPLADDVTVYPAHGAGSACGKNMQKKTVDTLGNQKKSNYALNQPNKEAFVKAITDGLMPPPAYFGMNVAMNKGGYQSFDTVLEKGLKPLSVEEFETAAEEAGALILDTRKAAIFHQGFIPQSINIGIAGDFAPWVGAMIVNVNQPLLLVTDKGAEEEVITRLSRVGFDHVLGYLEGGFETWKNKGKEIDTVKRISVEEFVNQYKNNDKVIDLRRASEYETEHIENAYNMPLDYINNWINDIDSKEHFYLHCAGGYRSMIAASILQARGYRNFTEIEGGFNAIKTTQKIPTTDFVCQSKIFHI